MKKYRPENGKEKIFFPVNMQPLLSFSYQISANLIHNQKDRGDERGYFKKPLNPPVKYQIW